MRNMSRRDDTSLLKDMPLLIKRLDRILEDESEGA